MKEDGARGRGVVSVGLALLRRQRALPALLVRGPAVPFVQPPSCSQSWHGGFAHARSLNVRDIYWIFFLCFFDI